MSTLAVLKDVEISENYHDGMPQVDEVDSDQEEVKIVEIDEVNDSPRV